MKTIIAEKPSVAREIAGLVGASDKKDGYRLGAWRRSGFRSTKLSFSTKLDTKHKASIKH